MTFYGWWCAVIGISLVRTFLENIGSRAPEDIGTTSSSTLIHYALFYIVTLPTLAIIVHIFSGRSILQVIRFALFGFLIVLTPPLIDLVLSGGSGYRIAYLFVPFSELLPNFITLFGAHTLPGITPGIRIEVVIILFIIFFYVRAVRGGLIAPFIATFTTYGALFFLFSLPTLLGMTDLFSWFITFKESFLYRSHFAPFISFQGLRYIVEMYYSVALTQILYLYGVGILIFFALLWNAQKLRALLSNARWERITLYLIMVCVGMGIAVHTGAGARTFGSLYDYTTLCILAFSFFFAWMFAVGTNDIVDQHSDAISNTNRPLVTGTLTRSDIEHSNLICLGAALLGGYLVGHYAFFFIIAFTAIYYVYSIPPLQLKRFVGINSFLISLAMLSAVLAGFYTLSGRGDLGAFPREWIFLIIGIYTLLANVKDIKDIDGDRAVSVYTIPVLLGDVWGKRIIALLSSLALALVPILLQQPILFTPWLPFSLLAYYFITRKPFREKPLFFLYFLYLLTCFLLFVGTM